MYIYTHIYIYIIYVYIYIYIFIYIYRRPEIKERPAYTLAFTRYCYAQYCTVYGIKTGGWRGVNPMRSLEVKSFTRTGLLEPRAKT